MKHTRIPAWARRLSASVALTSTAFSALVWGAAPALAVTSFSSSGGQPVIGAGGTVPLEARVVESQQLRSIKSFEVTLRAVDAPVAFSTTVTDAGELTRDRSVCIHWNPAATSTSGGARSGNCGAPVTVGSMANGTYELKTSAWTCTVAVLGALGCVDQASQQPGETRTFRVNVPPRTPTGVKVRLDASPVVSWTANPEPDITAYRIFRSDVNKQVGTVLVTADSPKPTSWTDPCQAPNACTPGTAMTYKVAAVRRSPVESGGVVSAYSGPTGNVALPVPPPPSPGAAGAPGGAPAVSNPQNLPAPQPSALPSVVAPTKQIVAPQTRSDRYAPTLPYDAPLPQDATAPVQAPPPGAEAQQGQQVAAETVQQPDRPKAQYIAGALVLLMAAMHLARGGGMLLRGSADEKAAASESSRSSRRAGASSAL
jgi:hypothetical protein